ncbi:MAG: tRNA lysidine(34) synthetase TilS [Candidatus Competibacteraceae bacterium]|nr:tRNA lysidine(34) synthetase TilS [Candidatus Competibacteraceae bacterium]
MGYSGGVDSHVLLHLLATQRPRLGYRELAAIYVDHGLHLASAQWGQQCQAVCQALGVVFKTLACSAQPNPGVSPEAAARHARYAALTELLQEHDALLTGHHQDDQAETLLLQLFRGAGPAGLAAMPVSTRLGRGWLWRPLLQAKRTEILTYAHSHSLRWVDDTSNFDQSLDRNYLRHSLLPQIKARWPAVTHTLARSARLCAESSALLHDLADQDLQAVSGEQVDCLNIPALRSLDEPRQRNLLKRWFQRLRLPPPRAIHLEHILHDAIAVHRDRQPLIHWPGCEVRRYRDQLYAMPPLPPLDKQQLITLVPEQAEWLMLGVGTVRGRFVQGQGLSPTALANASLTLRLRQGGERLRPVSRRQSQTLKKLLQDIAMPPWERDRLPLLFANDHLAAVVGIWVAAGSAATPDEQGFVLEFSPLRRHIDS